MTARINESRNSPLVAPNASLTLASGVQTVTPCQKLVMYFSAAGNLTVRTLEGASTTISTITGLVILDIQFDLVTWTGTASGAGLYTQ